MRLERILVLATPSSIRIDTGRLAIARKDQPPAYVALVDIAAVVLESPEVVITGACIQALVERDIPVLVADTRHRPAAVLFPTREHVSTVDRQRRQATLDPALKKDMWARIIRAKIANQRLCLAQHGQSKVLARMEKLEEKVGPGDASNCEAQAAQVYWQALFGKDFRRDKPAAQDNVNVALNYGYTVLRAAVARYVALSALSPIYGIGHDNRENPMCLVDDLMEPFRPMVDAHVISVITPLTPDWNSNAKQTMLKLLEREVSLGEKNFRLVPAVWESVQSYVRAMMSADPAKLALPTWKA